MASRLAVRLAKAGSLASPMTVDATKKVRPLSIWGIADCVNLWLEVAHLPYSSQISAPDTTFQGGIVEEGVVIDPGDDAFVVAVVGDSDITRFLLGAGLKLVGEVLAASGPSVHPGVLD